MTGPLRILACWPYSRRGWVAPLEGLAARGHDITYLAYRRREEEPAEAAIPPDRARRYWHEFRDGRQVVRDLRPDRVVLMATEGAWAIGVVAAARAAGVPTAVLQHGVFSPDAEEAARAAPLVRALGTPGTRTRLPALRFLLRTLAGEPLHAIAAVRFLVATSRSTVWEVAPRHRLLLRTADAYLVASTRAGRYFMEMDHVGSERIVPVGLAEFDALLLRPLPPPKGGTALLIDTPHTGGPHGVGAMTGKEKSAAIARIGADLARAGWSLTVKLHPNSYADSWAVDTSTVRYVRDVDLGDILAAATVVLGFDSTLLIPALHHRPGLLLHLGTRGWFPALATEMGAAPPSRPLEEVTADDVLAAAANADGTRDGRALLIEELLGPLDGRSLERLERALLDLRIRP